MIAHFFVPGIPQPGGSKRGFVVNGKAVLTEANVRAKPWRASVQGAAMRAYTSPPATGPLCLTITFVLPRPKSHYRADTSLKPTAPRFHTSRPDATKLLRAAEDALTGILWRDDAQVAQQVVVKRYGIRPGAHIRVTVACENAQEWA